ncbi:MAG: 50S ribosomal protein L28 [Chloroflexota bacterium]|nr:50S ribosomal protein L28 [Chloroflexota bacterium]
MSGKCDVCGKRPQFGQNIQHQHGGGWALRAPRTKRMWRPNIQRHTIQFNGQSVQINICTRCLRTAQKVEKSATKP